MYLYHFLVDTIYIKWYICLIKIQKHHIEKRDDYDKKNKMKTSYLYGSRVCNITDCRDNLLFII